MTVPLRLYLPRGASPMELEALSRAANGLPGRRIDAGTPWHNPYDDQAYGGASPALRRRLFIDALGDPDSRKGWLIRARVHELAGFNLVCSYCTAGAPCHGDVLLALANPDLAFPGACRDRPAGGPPASHWRS